MSPAGRVVFLRSLTGDDPVLRLWVLDPDAATPRLVADPARLPLDAGPDDQTVSGEKVSDEKVSDETVSDETVSKVSAEERARRERVREKAGGIVAYATDREVTRAVFTLNATAYLAQLTPPPEGETPAVWELPGVGPGVHDPRQDPTGSRVAYVADRSLYVAPADPAPHPHPHPQGVGRLLAGEDDPAVAWGVAEFVAAEEMGRARGFWWAPDGTRLVAARVDEQPVAMWWVADPSQPHLPPTPHRYPAAGTANARVRLFVLDLEGGRTEVSWDQDALPYLAQVTWEPDTPLTLLVQSRDQRTLQLLAADADTGVTRVLHTQTDPAWVTLTPGVPRLLPAPATTRPRLLTTIDDPAPTGGDGGEGGEGGGTRRLALDGQPCTPAGLQVRRVLAADAGQAVLAGGPDPTQVHLWRLDLAAGTLTQLTTQPGVHDGAAAGTVLVVTSATLDTPQPTTRVHRPGQPEVELPSAMETPLVSPRPRLARVGRRRLATALLLPHHHDRSAASTPRRWPVLLDPYGGPGAQRVLHAQLPYATAQWFADQGFAVLVTDGRGTPGRGPGWERAVAGDLAAPVLDDQVDALHEVAATHPELDLDRVAIRGWSFGGYLAALAVLRHPEVFHAAVAGAPVTDWHLYDTHYTERYLGHPQQHPEHYTRTSLLADAARLRRPLLLIHGLADDNVVAAHTLQLSSALLAAGRPHTVLPLSGVTHQTPQEVVAENLLRLQLAFLRQALDLPEPTGGN